MSNNNYQHHKKKIIRPVIKIQKRSRWEYTIQDGDAVRGKMWAQYIKKNDSNIATIFIKTSTANHYSVSHSPWMGQQSITGLTRATTARQTTSHSHIHSYKQFRITNLPNQCVFELWEETWAQEASIRHKRTFSLWGHSTTVHAQSLSKTTPNFSGNLTHTLLLN